MHHILTRVLFGFVVATVGCGAEEAGKAVVTTGAGLSGRASVPAAVAAERQVSMVRFVNVMVGSSALTVRADTLTLFANVPFGSVTAYREVRENLKTFSFQEASRQPQLIASTKTLKDGERYTIIALTDREGGSTLEVITDDLTSDSAHARVRIVNAAVLQDDISVLVSGKRDPLFDDLDYGTVGDFKEVSPGRIRLTLRRAALKDGMDTVLPLKVDVGKSYTVVLTGSGTAGGALRAVTFIDELVPPRARASDSAAVRGSVPLPR